MNKPTMSDELPAAPQEDEGGSEEVKLFVGGISWHMSDTELAESELRQLAVQSLPQKIVASTHQWQGVQSSTPMAGARPGSWWTGTPGDPGALAL